MARSPLITIRQARAIDGVAADAGLVRASNRLGISQSSLSRHVSDAERTLGHKLFQRGWNGMEPTSAGAIVMAHCRRMMSSIDAARASLEADGVGCASLGHHLTWELLDTVHAVRATGSVTHAADYLRTSQPNVSRALAKVSAAIGRPAFRRRRTGVEPNAAAGILCDLRGRLLIDALPLADQLKALTGELTGRVAVGLLPFSEQTAVIEVFGAMMRRHRHVRLQAVTGSYAALIDGLLKNELDFVVGLQRNQLPFDSLQEIHLYDESFAVVARAGHPLARRKPSLPELLRQNWMVAPHGTPTRHYFEDLLAREGLAPPRQTCEIVTFHLAEQMILHSDAIGLMTYSERKRAALRTTGLKILPLDLPDRIRPIGLTYRRRHRLTPAQRSFMELLLDKSRSHRTPSRT